MKPLKAVGDENCRSIWLAQLLLALEEVGMPALVHRECWNWLEAMSLGMLTSDDMNASPRRYPFDLAAELLRPFMATRRRPIACPR